jgi:signal transduction histidine kinase
MQESRFWAVQAMVVGLAGAHLALDVVLSDKSTSVMPAGIPVALLIVPISYAALHYGLAGSVSTSVWATLLWLPDLLLPHDEGHVGNDLIELGVVMAVAVFVGRHIESEQVARFRAERAEREHRASEARVRRYAGLLLGAHEEERRRLAQELHDEPLQVLVYLARHLERLESAPAVPPDLARSLDQARRKAVETMVNLRAVVQGLHPPAIERLGLVAALRGFLADVTEDTGTPCELRVLGAERRLTPETELGVFRIAQESVNNASRHAAAGKLCLVLDFSPNSVTLEVHDDGSGFSAEALDAQVDPAHFGIEGMRERARFLGGTVEIRSAVGRGTTVKAVIPTAVRAGV